MNSLFYEYMDGHARFRAARNKRRKILAMNKWIYVTLKILAAIFCIVLFGIQAYDILLEYTAEKTNIGVEFWLATSLPLPYLTICPAQGAKTSIDSMQVPEEEFIGNTYNIEELVFDYQHNDSTWKMLREVI